MTEHEQPLPERSDGFMRRDAADRHDPVNKPSHYTRGKIEVADFIEDQELTFHEGTILQYVVRCRFKGTPVQDCKKARWWLDRYIAILESEATK